MNDVIAAIYTTKRKDDFYHASMSCPAAAITANSVHVGLRQSAELYIVGRVEAAIAAGKHACRCWTLDGYQADNDPVAAWQVGERYG